MRKVLLVILDGWGHSDFEGPASEGNAIELASVPRFRSMYDRHPRTRLACSGEHVGLPEGQMGNSEVGHLTLGAGRITDGRDTSPTGGIEFVGALDRLCARSDRWAIASVTGRYWAMDRDKRWDRTRRACDLIVGGQAGAWADGVELLQNSYRAGVTDEFVEPPGIRGVGEAGVEERDAVLLLNFRSDRMRQLTAALTRPDFDGFERARARPVDVVTLTEYEADLPVSVAFSPEHVKPCLAQVLADAGLMQLKVAETEKYAHATYFFNGGEEAPFEGEDRTLVPSPKVATYDLQPEMSARGVADAVLEGMRSGTYDFILVNFANPDMVGHTGRVSAARCAVEAVDACLGDLLDAIGESPEWVALVTADHGNCEMMIDAEGNVHTAHTTEPVDFVVVDPQGLERHISGPGKLADVAPTVLDLMGIDAPAQMPGVSLLPEAAGEDLACWTSIRYCSVRSRWRMTATG